MKIFLIEDNPIHALEMEKMISILGYKYLGVSSSFEESVSQIEQLLPAIVICNVSLDSGKTGIDLAHKVQHLGIPFIFISPESDKTVYLESKNYFLSRFLVKPFDRLTLASVLDHLITEIQELTATKSIRGKHLFIRKNNLFEKVHLDTIDYMYAEGNYITLFSQTRKYVLKYSMSKLLSLRKFNNFLRVHRSYAVSILKIDSVSFADKEIKIADITIPFGRTYIKDIRELMGFRF